MQDGGGDAQRPAATDDDDVEDEAERFRQMQVRALARARRCLAGHVDLVSRCCTLLREGVRRGSATCVPVPCAVHPSQVFALTRAHLPAHTAGHAAQRKQGARGAPRPPDHRDPLQTALAL